MHSVLTRVSSARKIDGERAREGEREKEKGNSGRESFLFIHSSLFLCLFFSNGVSSKGPKKLCESSYSASLSLSFCLLAHALYSLHYERTMHLRNVRVCVCGCVFVKNEKVKS